MMGIKKPGESDNFTGFFLEIEKELDLSSVPGLGRCYSFSS
jgi:hypothetical protein